MARDKQHNFTLHLRPHTAKILQYHCRQKNGVLQIRDSTIIGSLIWSQIQPVNAPLKTEYAGLEKQIDVKLTCRYKRGVQWQNVAWHIDRPSMKRIDKWINDFFTWSIYSYFMGMNKPSKAKATKYFMAVYKLSEDDIKYDTIYMDLRRKETEAKKHPDPMPILKSLANQPLL